MKRFSAAMPPAGSSSRRKERRASAASAGGRGAVEDDVLEPDRASSRSMVMVWLESLGEVIRSV